MPDVVQLLAYLAQAGPSRAAELYRNFGITQQAFSRLVRSAADRVVVTGKARATRYAARRQVAGVGHEVPVYVIDEAGHAHRAGTLAAVEPRGFWVAPTSATLDAHFHDDLPYFLNDQRPAGFLGRLIPQRHPELDAPADITRWSADDCLRYFCQLGWNLPGSFIVGDAALEAFVEDARAAPPGIAARDRATRYPEIVDHLLEYGPAGSSAAGERPKFLVRRESGQECIVKFSPPTTTAVGQRWADLLRCEHVAHQVVAEHGLPAAGSEIVEAGGRVFLEVERFDRTPGGGRRGVISLMSLDLELVGSRLRSWGVSVEQLCRDGLVDDVALRVTHQLELFGSLIGNTDMHMGNLSFMSDGERLLEVAPAYDMVPMLFAPQHDQVVERELVPPTPRPVYGPLWREPFAAAIDFWERIARSAAVSPGFAQIAGRCTRSVQQLEVAMRRLPT